MRWMPALGLVVAPALAVAADRHYDLVGRLTAFAAPYAGGLIAAHPAAPTPPASNTAKSNVPAASTPPAQPAPRKVRVVIPKAAAAQFTLTLPGRTAPLEQARLSARAAGLVAERHGEIGDRVKAGDTLVVIDAPEVRQALERARAAVRQVEARRKLAELSFKRAEVLVPKNTLPEQTLDERRAALDTAKADQAAAQAEVRRLEEILAFQIVKAPFDGTITARQVERGDRVGGDQAPATSFLYTIARLEQLRVEIDVPQAMALKVKPGTSARMVFGELPGRTFDAKVVRTAQSLDAASSTMRAELVMDNANLALPAGLNGQVLLDIAREDACVQVPGNALIVQQGNQVVALADADNKISYRTVRIGRDLGNEVEVCTGLTVNDRVILSPNALLKAGDTIEVLPQN